MYCLRNFRKIFRVMILLSDSFVTFWQGWLAVTTNAANMNICLHDSRLHLASIGCLMNCEKEGNLICQVMMFKSDDVKMLSTVLVLLV